jgi:hypothetical protein
MSQQMNPEQRRAGVDAVLARIAADPGYRRSLKDDPSAALASLAIDPAAETPAEVFGLCTWETCRRTSCKTTWVTK